MNANARPHISLVLLGALILAGASSARAEIVTFTFEATVDQVQDGLGVLGGAIQPGSRLHGALIFDTETPGTPVEGCKGGAGTDHHFSFPPVGANVRFDGGIACRSIPAAPDLDMTVQDNCGITGMDTFAFISRANQATGLAAGPPVDELEFGFIMRGEMLTDTELPTTPPPVAGFGMRYFFFEGRCSMCAGPAAFFRVDATLTALDANLILRLDRGKLSWIVPEVHGQSQAFDVLQGDLAALRAGGGEFSTAVTQCLANNQSPSTFPHSEEPGVGSPWWFLVRRVNASGPQTWDSSGLAQRGGRDASIAASPFACP